MTVSTFVPTAAGNQSVNTYTGAIDGDFSVLTRLGVAFAPHAQAVPNMTVALDAGHIFNGTDLTEVPPQTTATIAAPVTDPRIDRVVIDRLTGVVSVVTGTESAAPVAPAFPAGKVPVACVLVQPGMIVITNDAITDERSLYSLGSSASTGGLINVQVFSTPGTYTYTPTPGTTKVIVEVQAGGGKGGDATSTASLPGCGSGGSPGGYAKSLLTSDFSGVTVLVGVGGSTSHGGPSEFGSTHAVGGSFGLSGSAVTPPALTMPLWGGLGSSNGNIVNASVGGGMPGFALGSSLGSHQIAGGAGGASKFGPGGGGGSGSSGVNNQSGEPAQSHGAGGGGACAIPSEPGTYLGGKGGDGIVIVYEYA